MDCPICHKSDTKVIDSRALSDFSIRRRRECEKCGGRFSTVEEIEILNLTVIKRDGSKEPYTREKIAKGIKLACEKRCESEEAVLRLVNAVEQDILNEEQKEITSKKIGQLVMSRLKEKDEVAYLRFASVCKDFKSAESFQKEIKVLTK